MLQGQYSSSKCCLSKCPSEENSGSIHSTNTTKMSANESPRCRSPCPMAASAEEQPKKAVPWPYAVGKRSLAPMRNVEKAEAMHSLLQHAQSVSIAIQLLTARYETYWQIEEGRT
ncbi:hypothetical protein CKAH01_12398 [Colletotrichum kahawae]|uniref:Uncharacterized protein n=1 Tax=Colletotrichum kahawae TaxID=34407 RepID=A0AAE0DF75_COLKA|nr:hypothetical protein CKAH01_12398 [Colletotrichum kahawae]